MKVVAVVVKLMYPLITKGCDPFIRALPNERVLLPKLKGDTKEEKVPFEEDIKRRD